MKKVKLTNRPAPREGLTLKPSRLRMFVIYAFLFALAVLFGLLIRLILSPSAFGDMDWNILFLAVFGGAAVMAFIEQSRWVLRVRKGGELLEGTTGAFGARVTIPIDSIDWERTRRSLSSWLKIGNSIYVTSIQRIMVSPWFFDPHEFSSFIKAIGYIPPETHE
jgi:hypothetical protein